jgi:phosphoserine phosphatase RsbU/P
LTRRLHLIAGGLVFGLFLAYATLNGAFTFGMVLNSGNPSWLPSTRGDVLRVGPIRPGGPADGRLQRGDEVVAFEGHGVVRGFDLRRQFAGRPPGGSYRLLVRRDDGLHDVVLRTESYGFSFASFFMLAFPLVGAVFLLGGLVVYWLKPGHKQAVLLGLALLLFSGGGGVLYPDVPAGPLPAWMSFALIAAPTLSICFWPVFLHLCLVFPQPTALLGRLPSLEAAIYLPLAGLLPMAVWGGRLLASDPATGSALLAPSSGFGLVFGFAAVCYSVAALLALVFNYRQADEPGRRKLGVVVAGCVAGLLPFVLFLSVSLFGDLRQLPLWVNRCLLVWMLLSLPLVPLAFAHAIVRHRVIPVRLMLRRGLRYLLVSRGVVIAEATLLGALLVFVLTGSRAASLEGFGPRADVVATAFVTALGIVAFTPLNRRVMPALDRRFFREEYDAQQVLDEIAGAARTLPSISEFLALASRRIDAALHPESLTVFLRDPESRHYVSVFPEGLARMSAEAPVVARLGLSPRSLESELGGLSLPIVARGELLGILSVGRRRGDFPYSGDDRRLLEAVAWQLAFAIENAQLVERRAEEERLRREVALASEVQRRLFPAEPPPTRRLDLAGLCHPAQGVGGDYYDFLVLPDGHIGLAVADVAGKGLSAALLMSIVQASLRSQARNDVSPGALVASMNDLLYRSMARNCFASFFYARFDEASGRLDYVNAGHNPPLLVRSGDGSGPPGVWPLSTGGLVLGAIADATYEHASVALEPDDVLVAYTDGVTESFSAAGEEFGEGRLRDVVLASLELPAAALADAIVAAVRAWSHGEAQHDDLTLIVARVR